MKLLFIKLKSNYPLIWIVSALILIALVAGCMETTSPSNSNERKLTVLAYQIDQANPKVKQPLKGADVKITATNALTTAQSFTNDLGAAVFSVTTPLIGANYNISATYNSKTQLKSSLLICNDTTVVFLFDTVSVANIDCNALNGSETLTFVDDQGNAKLKQNTPVNVNKYDRCSAGIYNNSQQDMTIAIPSYNDTHFTLNSVVIDGAVAQPVNGSYILKPGQTLTVCFSVSTKDAGVFNSSLNITVKCGNNQTGTYKINLNAEVVAPDCNCDPANTSFTMGLTDRLPIGQSKDIQNTVFTNNSPCAVTISKTSFDGNDGWQILSPNFPVTVQPGQSLSISARFTAVKAMKSIDTLKLNIQYQGTNNNCSFDVYLNGNACSSSCPFYSLDRSTYKVFGSGLVYDTLSNRVDKRVFASVPTINPPIFSTVTTTYYFRVPDTACTDVNINISVQYADGYAQKYFTVSPQSLSLSPGEIGSIQVTFTAPTIEEMAAIVAARGNRKITADSAFSIKITASTPGCSQVINAAAVVSIYPDISPIINLRAYDQKTPLKSDPENEVYYFGDPARTITKGPGNTPGPYPPIKGNIWVDVDDNNASANPPQEPILKSVSSLIGMKVWRSNVPESQFSNVASIYNQFVSDPNYSTGYTTSPLRGLKVGDIIAFQISPKSYALIYIRRIDTGTEQTSSKQSGIEFRSIYPIYIP